MRTSIPIVAFLSLMVGVGAGALKWRGGADGAHHTARMAVIISHAHQMPDGGVLVIGDSITEQIRFETLCGLPALNAGIGRATSESWLPDAQLVIDATRPSVVVLALGTNDRDNAFEKLVPLADFAVLPADPQKAAFERGLIRSVSGPTSTIDGVHPDLRGAEQWKAAVEEGCARLTHQPRAVTARPEQ